MKQYGELTVQFQGSSRTYNYKYGRVIVGADLATEYGYAVVCTPDGNFNCVKIIEHKVWTEEQYKQSNWKEIVAFFSDVAWRNM